MSIFGFHSKLPHVVMMMTIVRGMGSSVLMSKKGKQVYNELDIGDEDGMQKSNGRRDDHNIPCRLNRPFL